MKIRVGGIFSGNHLHLEHDAEFVFENTGNVAVLQEAFLCLQIYKSCKAIYYFNPSTTTLRLFDKGSDVFRNS